MKRNIVIDRSYNKFTIDEILDMTAGYEEVDICSDFTESFDLIYQLTDMGGAVYPYGRVLRIEF